MAKANAKFMAPLTPSAELAAVVGSAALPRTEVVKKMWEYIKKNGLQDAKNKRRSTLMRNWPRFLKAKNKSACLI